MPREGGGWLIESRLDETDERKPRRTPHIYFTKKWDHDEDARRMMMMEDDLHLPWQSELVMGTTGTRARINKPSSTPATVTATISHHFSRTFGSLLVPETTLMEDEQDDDGGGGGGEEEDDEIGHFGMANDFGGIMAKWGRRMGQIEELCDISDDDECGK
ncbi:hypothetical protein niasHS_008698 [Heterodera schachtii]|uniref:Uncharacterized protein n=1 Tax=Heterodera schachtii TaxID=97005 RepID=A0ABD2JAS3_HETSC